MAGKTEWFAFGLPMEGTQSALPQACDVVRSDVPVCRPGQLLGDVYQHTQAAHWNVCVVVDEDRVILGRLRREVWQAEPRAPVEQVMENGPTTVRPDEPLEPLVKRMRDRKVESVLVSNPDGVLIGVVYRNDAEAFLEQRAQAGQAPTAASGPSP